MANVTEPPTLVLGGDRDRLFAERAPGPFVFDADVVRVFDDMVDRSVPLYRATEHAVASTVASVVPDGGRVLDLGCSTGTGTLAIANACQHRNVTVEGWDRSPEMVARAREKANGVAGVTYVARDIVDATLPDVAAICAIYTMQFTPPDARPALLGRVRAALPPGGAFVWAEKMAAPDPATQTHWDAMYDAYKLDRGYSPVEIEAKRRALSGVLVPWTEERWRVALAEAGFTRVTPLLRWLPFGSFVAWTD